MRLIRFRHAGSLRDILVNPQNVTAVGETGGKSIIVHTCDGKEWPVNADSLKEVAEKLELGMNLP